MLKINLKLFAYSALGALLVLSISLFNSGFVNERPFLSYLMPLLVGAFSGGLGGFLYLRMKQHQLEREELFFDIIEVLAMALEERDSYTHGHAQRVTSFAIKLGELVGLKEHNLRQLHLASILHDIGKIGIPDKVLLKQEPLTDKEWNIIRTHSEKGARILNLLRDPRMGIVIDAVRHHHERYDGKGYPEGLKGSDIPFLGRIIAVADSFDAMISDRPYRKGLSKEEALKEIERCANTQFDPQLVQLFVEYWKGRMSQI